MLEGGSAKNPAQGSTGFNCSGLAHPLFRKVRPHRLDPIAAFDDVRLQRDGTRSAVELEEETAGVAKDGAHLVATP